MIHKHVLNYF